MKCARENTREDKIMVRNEELKRGKEILEKAVAEVIKIKDRDIHSAEFMQHKWGERWELIETNTRNVLKGAHQAW